MKFLNKESTLNATDRVKFAWQTLSQTNKTNFSSIKKKFTLTLHTNKL